MQPSTDAALVAQCMALRVAPSMAERRTHGLLPSANPWTDPGPNANSSISRVKGVTRERRLGARTGPRDGRGGEADGTGGTGEGRPGESEGGGTQGAGEGPKRPEGRSRN